VARPHGLPQGQTAAGLNTNFHKTLIINKNAGEELGTENLLKDQSLVYQNK
jgi:hypothetical protein